MLRRVDQKSFLEALTAPAEERKKLVFGVGSRRAAGCVFRDPDLRGASDRATWSLRSPGVWRRIRLPARPARAIANLLGGGDSSRVGVPPPSVPPLIKLLVRSGAARWNATGKTLIDGDERAFDPNFPPKLPPRSAIVVGDTGPWYFDAATGQVGARKASPHTGRARGADHPTRAGHQADEGAPGQRYRHRERARHRHQAGDARAAPETPAMP